jgi:methylamine utilization protein MauE
LLTVVPSLGFACLCVVGLVFGVSAVGKLRGRGGYGEFVAATQLLLLAVGFRRLAREPATRLVSGVVVAAEVLVPVLLVASVLFVVPGLGWLGLGLAMFLLAGFGVGIGAAVRRGVRTSCRCFGASSIPLGKQHLVRNVFLIVVAATGLVAGTGGHGSTVGMAIAAGTALVAAVLVVRLDDLLDLFTPTKLTR